MAKRQGHTEKELQDLKDVFYEWITAKLFKVARNFHDSFDRENIFMRKKKTSADIDWVDT
jgi:hypothetical protein